jgi:general stress protein YciG
MSISWYQKRVYESVFGTIPKGFHVHRIVPGYLGGKYEIGNVIALYHEDHVLIHKYRWLKHKDPRDYIAYKMLEERRGLTSYERSSLGGKISGVFKSSEFQREQGRKGGKKGLGPHVDREKYSESRKAGGAASAKLAKANKKGSLYIFTTCPFCRREHRVCDTRWHKDAKCLNKPGKTNDLA